MKGFIEEDENTMKTIPLGVNESLGTPCVKEPVLYVAAAVDPNSTCGPICVPRIR